MAVCEIQVGVLQEGGGGQQDIGVIGGVVLKLLEYHGEQVVAPQAAQNLVLVGRDGRGVGVVDHHGLHRRMVQAVERGTQLGHIHQPRFASERLLLEVGTFQAGPVQMERLRGGKLQSAADILPRAGERRQVGDGPHRHRAALAALHSVIEPDGRGPRGGVLARKRGDVLRRNAGELGRALRGPLAHAIAQAPRCLRCSRAM